MNKIFIVILVFAVSFSEQGFSQDEIDSVTNKSIDSSNYVFELSLKPQDGYSIILCFYGSPKVDVEFYDFEIGIARTISIGGHEGGIVDRTITLGLIKYNSNTYYTLGFGYNYRSILDLGLFLNFNNNFNGSNAFTLRPNIGFIFLPPIGSAYVEVGYNINFLKNDFDIPNYFVVGFRYNIGFLKNKIQ